MILDNIENCEKYYALGEGFKEAFELLKTFGADIAEGRFEKNGFTGSVTLKTPEDCANTKLIFESHKKYADIHYVVAGFEHFGYRNTKYLKEFTNYSEKDDCCYFQGEPVRLPMDTGDFCIMLPGDAHIPDMGCTADGVKRAVVKVELEQKTK